MSQQPNLLEVDWSKIPPPGDDGGARHLEGMALPGLALPSTAGGSVVLAQAAGRTIAFAYPMTGRPGLALPQDWDFIPGARGCTPQACGFRDLDAQLRAAGANFIFGLSTQDTSFQLEAAKRLHLPFPLLSDERLVLANELGLPLLDAGGKRLLKRLALVIDDGRICKAFYPVFPPDRNAFDVLAWLKENPR